MKKILIYSLIFILLQGLVGPVFAMANMDVQTQMNNQIVDMDMDMDVTGSTSCEKSGGSENCGECDHCLAVFQASHLFTHINQFSQRFTFSVPSFFPRAVIKPPQF